MVRIFTLDDLLAFASLSGDYNPIHTDPIASRRLLFGRPIVHGMHALLWAIDVQICQRGESNTASRRIEKLSVDFRSPMIVNEPVELVIHSTGNDGARFELSAAGALAATIDILLKPVAAARAVPTIPSILPEIGKSRVRTSAEARVAAGRVGLCMERTLAGKMFPHATRFLLPEQIAMLLAASRMVGMEMPGMHSLDLGLELVVSDELIEPELIYSVQDYDERFPMLLPLNVKAPGFVGKLSAALRPPPTDQATMAEIRQLVKPDEFRGELALVIGGSRGLGELAVKQLASGGAEVRFTYHLGSTEAHRIVADIAAPGDSVRAIQFDVQNDAERLASLLGGWSPTLFCYFATPFISSGVAGNFSTRHYREFCSFYIDGFLSVFNKVKDKGLTSVVYPSSTAIVELPPKMAEYAAAKAASETLCATLAKTHPKIRFHYPRLPRLATDQTATLMPVDNADPKPVILDLLRRVRRQEATAPASRPQAAAEQAGPAFAVAATFTAEPLEPTLSFWLEKLGQPPNVAFASYNQVFQALLDPTSAIASAPWAAAVLLRFEDWIEGDKSKLDAAQWNARLSPLVDEFLAAVGSARRTPLIVVICPPSPTLSSEVAGALAKMEKHVIKSLAHTPGVHGFAASAVSDLYPVDALHDPASDAIGKIPYTPIYFAALATFVIRMAHAVRRPPFKVIALDCDNTLWHGVCGEGGVSVEPGHRSLQQFALQQSEAGKLLCLVSKNVEQDVFDVFDQHPDMLLRRDSLVGYRINWSAKSRNLRELARELNVGLDSVIFVDDNPIECAEVRANALEVLTLQLPADQSCIEPFIRHVWAFDQLRVTDQDRKRAQSYRLGAQREAVRQQSGGLDDFLKRLQLEVTFAPVDPSNLARAAQMTERTNQFNASTIRRGEAQILELLRDGKHKAEVVQVKDRFGDYGIVGLVITQPRENALFIDTFLLSCRVLGRGVEHQMLARAGNAAIEGSLQYIDVPFLRTKRNQPALDFLSSLAMDHRVAANDGFLFHLPATFAAQVKASAITSAPVDESEVSPASSAGGELSAAKAPYQQIADHWRDAAQILADVEAGRRQDRNDLAATFRAPQTEREEKVAEIWQRVLGVDRISIDDDYFKLGGTSIMAVRLVLEIEKAFQQHLPIATLLSAPTVAQFARRLGEAPDAGDSSIVTLRAEGDGPPLFLLPGIGGHVMSFRRLVQLLETSQPVYGIELRPEDPQNRVPRSMEKIAGEVLDRLLRLNPDGPYLLSGWSFGGALAFEVAHQLRSRGKQVALIALFDAYPNGDPRPLPPKQRIQRHIHHLFQRSFDQQLKYIVSSTKALLNTVRHRILLVLGIRKTDFFMYGSAEIEEVVKVCDDAWQAYRPARWPGRLTLLRATVHPTRIGISYDDPTNGWKNFADEIDVRPVNTHHLGLFEDPAVQQTASELSSSIRAANGRSESINTSIRAESYGSPVGPTNQPEGVS